MLFYMPETSKEIYEKKLAEAGDALERGSERSKHFFIIIHGDLSAVKNRVKTLPCSYILVEEDQEGYLQIFVQLTSRQRVSYITRHMKKSYDGGIPLDIHAVSIRNPQEAKDYCTNEKSGGGWSIERGIFNRPTQIMSEKEAERLDERKAVVRVFLEKIKILCEDAVDKDSAFMACYEECPEYISLFETAWRYEVLRREEVVAHEMQEEAERAELRPWQSDLENALRIYQESGNTDRSVIVVLDPAGGAGKSFFVRHYMAKYPKTAVSVVQGKANDSPYDIQVAFLDLTRFQRGNANLSVVEMLKNGFTQSYKYMSGSRVLQRSPAWVIMTNNPLDWEKPTKDLWIILQPQSDGTAIMNTVDK